ncbi:hypothetical protein PENTCL1PPCAC_27944, partial [Pristionchus entomophagus]
LSVCLSSAWGESISFRGLTGSKPTVSNSTQMQAFLTSRSHLGEERLNLSCETRKNDYAAHEMAKTRFSVGCLGNSSLGVVPQIMGKLSSCYCSFNLTICEREVEVKNCVIVGPGRKSTRGFSVDSTHIYHVGFTIQLGGHLMDGRLDITTEASALPRNQTLADEPAAIMASEFSGWAYRVELECFGLRQARFCKRLATNATIKRNYESQWDLLAVIFGLAGAFVVACMVLFIHWRVRERIRRTRGEKMREIVHTISRRRMVSESAQSYDYHPSIRVHRASSSNTSGERTYSTETGKRRSTYL